jgi:hypothetical protein
MKNITIAVIKSEKYPDLWVSNIRKNAIELFKTTMMRCPSIGLFEYFDTEFIIINDTCEYPCNIYSHPAKDELDNIHHITENKVHVLPFLDDTYHKHTTMHNVSTDMDTINWSKYNIVITINACIPDRIIEEFPNVLWCYYISENDESFLQTKLGKYDVLLNQDVNQIQSAGISIGFPYTFLGPNTLESMYEQIYPDKPRRPHGMFIEINNMLERPVVCPSPEFQHISEECNIPVHIHKQNILENLHTLCNSKYYIKIYGRRIRGNGVLEAISAGALVLMNRSLVMYDDLIPDECDIKTSEDIINKITYFENNASEYEYMKRLQKQLLENLYAKKPANDLYNEYKKKSCIIISV